jgi:hypothetical protein
MSASVLKLTQQITDLFLFNELEVDRLKMVLILPMVLLQLQAAKNEVKFLRKSKVRHIRHSLTFESGRRLLSCGKIKIAQTTKLNSKKRSKAFVLRVFSPKASSLE